MGDQRAEASDRFSCTTAGSTDTGVERAEPAPAAAQGVSRNGDTIDSSVCSADEKLKLPSGRRLPALLMPLLPALTRERLAKDRGLGSHIRCISDSPMVSTAGDAEAEAPPAIVEEIVAS
mmetsp:Transcript_50850/g.129145  ORF Transcript_50850/g.129145 Transcript_50850/m.129145 type:complete len:120 (-) Transcript_50850:464-823(-)